MKTRLGLSGVSLSIILLIIFKSVSFSQMKDSCKSHDYGIVINPLIGFSSINDQATFIKGIRLGFQFNKSEAGISFENFTTNDKYDYYGNEKSNMYITNADLYFKKYYYLSSFAQISITTTVSYYHFQINHTSTGDIRWYAQYRYSSNYSYLFTKPEIELCLHFNKNLLWCFSCSYRLLISELIDIISTSYEEDKQYSGFNYSLGVKYIIRL